MTRHRLIVAGVVVLLAALLGNAWLGYFNYNDVKDTSTRVARDEARIDRLTARKIEANRVQTAKNTKTARGAKNESRQLIRYAQGKAGIPGVPGRGGVLGAPGPPGGKGERGLAGSLAPKD